MTLKVNSGIRIFIMVMGIILSFSALAADNGWAQYKQRFLLSDGRIVDTGNKNISHSEGQGYAMLLAVYNNDKPAFESMRKWTYSTLYRQDIGLFSWRYEPGKSDPIADKNNATDGDILIAWALLEAGKKWSIRDYFSQSTEIQKSLLEHTLITYAGYKVLLPGVSGFNQVSSITLNPSYFIFPAIRAFYAHSHLKIWKDLNNDAFTLVGKMAFGKQRIPTDWVSLREDGRLAPADGWPAHFGFNAVRVPLYIYWYQPDHETLKPFVNFWQGYDRLKIPAWIDVNTGEYAIYYQSSGMRAIRDLVMGQGQQISDNLADNKDYYSASLALLSYWIFMPNRLAAGLRWGQ